MWPPERIEVQWRDSIGQHGWQCSDEIEKHLDEPHVLEHTSCGYLVKETDDYIALTHSVGLVVRNISDTIQIPKCAVIKIRRLK